MKVIYEPKGAAREYAALAVNLFKGCTHACRYCYVPPILRRDRVAFHEDVTTREGVLEALERDAAALETAGDTRRVFLCFTCDPFPSVEGVDLTLQALGILGKHHRPVEVLTKSSLADLAFPILKHMDAKFGISLVWHCDYRRREWEPGASSVSRRVRLLESAQHWGIPTFVSMEPVVDPLEAFGAFQLVKSFAGEIRVGRLNHMEPPEPVEWALFANLMRDQLQAWAAKSPGRTWMLKKGLRELVEG